MPQEGGGLGRARTLQGPKVPLVPIPDEAPACMEETVAREERFCFVLVVLYYAINHYN